MNITICDQCSQEHRREDDEAWVFLRWSVMGGGDGPRDFCSLACLRVWLDSRDAVTDGG